MNGVSNEEYHCEKCSECATKFWIPLEIHAVAVIRKEDFVFWCPNGHGQSYLSSHKEPEHEDHEVVSFPVIDGGKK